MATNNIYPFNALTGGTNAGYLDYHPVATLADGDFASGIVGGVKLDYIYVAANAESENSPYIIIPDDNSSGTGAWVLVAPKGPMSHVQASTTAGQSIADSSPATIVYGTETLDSLGEFNTTTGVFTATYAGVYHVCANVVYENSISWAAGESAWVYVRVDSTVVRSTYLSAIATGTVRFPGQPIATSVYLTAGQTIDIQTRQDTGGAIPLEDMANINWLTIDRIM